MVACSVIQVSFTKLRINSDTRAVSVSIFSKAKRPTANRTALSCNYVSSFHYFTHSTATVDGIAKQQSVGMLPGASDSNAFPAIKR